MGDNLEHKYLEGEPAILSSAVDQDAPDPGRIKGETTVDKSQTEGTIAYDILFSAYSPKRKQDSKVIINVESQNQWNPVLSHQSSGRQRLSGCRGGGEYPDPAGY